MAHQSALAGIMLATELLVASSDDLRALRPMAPEGRFNVLVGLPQSPARARTTLTKNCLCTDADYVTAWKDQWSSASTGDALGVAAAVEAEPATELVEGGDSL
jgi:hypothetical protein